MIPALLIAFGALIVTLWLLIAPRHYERKALAFMQWKWMALFEAGTRAALGVLLVVFAESAAYPFAIEIFGWLLIAVGVFLALLPAATHRRFGEWVIPLQVRWRWLMALPMLALVGLLLFAAGIPASV